MRLERIPTVCGVPRIKQTTCVLRRGTTLVIQLHDLKSCLCFVTVAFAMRGATIEFYRRATYIDQFFAMISNFCSMQARSQALRFGGINTFNGGKNFVFIKCLKQTFLGTTQFGGTKTCRGNCTRMPAWLRA